MGITFSANACRNARRNARSMRLLAMLMCEKRAQYTQDIRKKHARCGRIWDGCWRHPWRRILLCLGRL